MPEHGTWREHARNALERGEDVVVIGGSEAIVVESKAWQADRESEADIAAILFALSLPEPSLAHLRHDLPQVDRIASLAEAQMRTVVAIVSAPSVLELESAIACGNLATLPPALAATPLTTLRSVIGTSAAIAKNPDRWRQIAQALGLAALDVSAIAAAWRSSAEAGALRDWDTAMRIAEKALDRLVSRMSNLEAESGRLPHIDWEDVSEGELEPRWSALLKQEPGLASFRAARFAIGTMDGPRVPLAIALDVCDWKELAKRGETALIVVDVPDRTPEPIFETPWRVTPAPPPKPRGDPRSLLAATGPEVVGLMYREGGQGEWPLLKDAIVTIGSWPDNTLVFREQGVSKRHVAIEVGDTVIARDIGSAGGTWVDAAKITWIALRDGSRIRIGDVMVRVLLK